MNPRQGPDQPVRMHTMASIATDGTQYITLTERIPPSEAGAEPGPFEHPVRPPLTSWTVLRTTISWGHTSFFPRGARIPTTEVMEDIPEEDEETWQDDAIDEDEPAPRRSSQPRRRPTVQRRGPSPSVAAEARAARAARRQNRRQTRATVVDEPEPEPEQPVASGSGSNRRGQRVPTSELGADLIDGLHKLGVGALMQRNVAQADYLRRVGRPLDLDSHLDPLDAHLRALVLIASTPTP